MAAFENGFPGGTERGSMHITEDADNLFCNLLPHPGKYLKSDSFIYRFCIKGEILDLTVYRKNN